MSEYDYAKEIRDYYYDRSTLDSFDDILHWADEIEQLRALAGKAEAIVARLPKTKDGVTVVPSVDRIWNWCARHGGYWEEITCPPASRSDWIAECYSTREAAEAASKGGAV